MLRSGRDDVVHHQRLPPGQIDEQPHMVETGIVSKTDRFVEGKADGAAGPASGPPVEKPALLGTGSASHLLESKRYPIHLTNGSVPPFGDDGFPMGKAAWMFDW